MSNKMQENSGHIYVIMIIVCLSKITNKNNQRCGIKEKPLRSQSKCEFGRTWFLFKLIIMMQIKCARRALIVSVTRSVFVFLKIKMLLS